MRLIDADALRNALNDAGGTGAERGGWADGWCKAIDAAIRMLEKAPTVEPEPQWIPVTERLPVENGNYIVTACYDIWNSTVVMVAEYYSGSRTWYDECCECSLEGIVTHWLPLPEPYNPAEEEGNT